MNMKINLREVEVEGGGVGGKKEVWWMRLDFVFPKNLWKFWVV